MNVFWGAGMCGKLNLKCQHIYGGKSIAYIGQRVVKKTWGTVHLTGYRHNKQFWDVTTNEECYHKRKDEDNIRVVSKESRKFNYILGNITRSFNLRVREIFPLTYITPVIHKESRISPNQIRLSKTQLEKYMQLKYVHSMAYYDCINQHFGNDKTNLLEKIKPKDYPDSNTIIPYNLTCLDKNSSEEIDDWYKDQRNIVPYKSDMLEFVTKILDGLADFRRDNKYGHDVIKAYYDDREFIYKYIDEMIDQQNKFTRRLVKRGIDFEYFDLDKGSYKKTFGLEKNLHRNLDNPVIFQLRNAKDKKQARERYFRLRDLAEKYINKRNIKDNRL